MTAPPRAGLGGMLPFFAALFIDLFSFGLMYPVVIALFHQPEVTRLFPPATLSILLAATFSLFPLGMFFGASLLGDLSDAFGRKRTLLLCMSGLTLSYALMLVGVQTLFLPVFLLGRLLSGLMAGTGPIAQAAMMDRSTEAERGRDLSRVTLVNCIALTSAPAAGGLLAHLDIRAPLLFTLLLCLAVLVLIARTPFAERAVRATLAFGWRRPFANFAHAARHPRIRLIAGAFFLFQLGFAIYFIYAALWMQRVAHLNPSGLGFFAATFGAGFVLGTVLVYPRVGRWIGSEAWLAAVALLLCGVFAAASAVAPGWVQWPLALLAAICNVVAYITLFSLLSQAATADEQGWAMGIGSAAVALAFFVSGLLASLLTVVSLTAILAAGGVVLLLSPIPLAGLRGVVVPDRSLQG